MSKQNQGVSRREALLEEKAKQITCLLEDANVDLWKLRGLAIAEGGLVNDSLRRKAWPKLVGLHERLWDEKDSRNEYGDDAASAETRKRGNTYKAPKSNDSRGAEEKAKDIFRSETSKRSEGKPPRSRREGSFKSLDDSNSISSSNSLRDKVLASSLDFSQIEMDVARCTWHLLTGTQRVQRMQMEAKRHRRVARLIRRKQRRLANLINLTLVQSYKHLSGSVGKDNTLRYYQGYHDVACIILSTLSGNSPVRLRSGSPVTSLEGMAVATGLDLPTAVLLQLSQSHFRDCMRANFMQLQTALRLTLLPMIALFDPTVHDFLATCEMEPFFALSWVITWFSHDIRDTELVKRLFDFFLVSHPLMPVYLAVAMVCHPLNREELLQTECDFSEVHQTLLNLPKNSSMVGWKFRPGDGYVSDDEADMDDESSVGVMDSQSSVDTDFLLHEEALQSIHAEFMVAEAVSTVSSSMSSMFEARVPFQQLIENAILYMERLPPRNLLKLATRYYGSDQVQSLTHQAPDISFLQTPPAWTRAPSAKSDWFLRKQDRQLRGLSPSSKDRKVGRSFSNTAASILDIEDEEDLKYLLNENNSRSLAAIAAGFGPGDDAERRRRKRRKRMIIGAAAVVVIAIGVGYLMRRSEWSASDTNNMTCGVQEGSTGGEALSCKANVNPEISKVRNPVVPSASTISVSTPSKDSTEPVVKLPPVYKAEPRPQPNASVWDRSDLKKVQPQENVNMGSSHGDRKGIESDVAKPALSQNSKKAGAETRKVIAKKFTDIQRSVRNDKGKAAPARNQKFLSYLFNHGATFVKHSVGEVQTTIIAPSLRSLTSSTKRIYGGLKEAFLFTAIDIDRPSDRKRGKRSLANTPLQGLDTDFRVHNVAHHVSRLANDIVQLSLKKMGDEITLGKHAVSVVARETTAQLSKARHSAVKAVNSPALHSTVRGASIAEHYFTPRQRS